MNRWTIAAFVGMSALIAGCGNEKPTSRSTSGVGVFQPGNYACPGGLTELKIEPVESGTYGGSGPLQVTLTVSGNAFDFVSNIGVDAVIVKGGPDSLVYSYPSETTSATGLTTNEGGKFGLSHISFCYDLEADAGPDVLDTAPPPDTTPQDSGVPPDTTPPQDSAVPPDTTPQDTGTVQDTIVEDTGAVVDTGVRFDTAPPCNPEEDPEC